MRSLDGGHTEENRKQHETCAVGGGGEKRPNSKVAKADLHAAVDKMLSGEKPKQAKDEKENSDGDSGVADREGGAGEKREGHNEADRQEVSCGDRNKRLPDRAAGGFLQAERDGEQPTHRGINPVPGTQGEERGPSPWFNVTHE